LPGQYRQGRFASLSIGLQIAGAPRSEALILDGAKVLENILGLTGTTPIDPRV
jgi:amidase